MTRRILLCLDESAFSEAAARIAIQLAKAHPSDITALHVINVRESSGNLIKDLPGRLGFEPAVVSSEVHRQHETAARSLLDAFGRDAEIAGVEEVELVLEHGAVADRIAHRARLSDLVVMGIRGATEERFPGQGGGILASVLSQVTVPVLFVTRDATEVHTVALGYDGSRGAAHAVGAIRVLGAGLGLTVHALYVSRDGESGGEVLDQLEGELDDDTTVVKHVVAGDEAHTALAATADEVGADVLALGFRGHNPLKDFLYGSATEFILMNTRLMVLVAH